MAEYSFQKASDFLTRNNRRRTWLKVVSALACVVVFCTVYALILPAVTLDKSPECGKEVHVHNDSCYARVDTETVLDCTYESLGVHVHDGSCYDADGKSVCGYADFAVHTHDGSCYDSNGGLVCELPEISVHEHTNDCYTYALEDLDEAAEDEPVPDSPDVAAAGVEGDADSQTEAESCAENDASAISATNVDSVEDDSVRELICSADEVILHEHDASCFDLDGNLVCGMVEVRGHVHDESCFRKAGMDVLTCGFEEVDGGHVHSDRCYGERVVICGMEEHDHTEACHANHEADLEDESIWESSLGNIEFTESRRRNLLFVAESQLGYRESMNNYIVDENGDRKSYTRYGAWYGDEYGDWDAMFCAFCLHYADITDYPVSGNVGEWVLSLTDGDLYRSAGEYTPVPGDFIFFGNGGEANRVGIVHETDFDDDGVLVSVNVIEGASDCYVKENTYDGSDPDILGYGVLTFEEDEFYPSLGAAKVGLLAVGDNSNDPNDLGNYDNSNNPYDLANYIESVVIKHRTPDGDWTELGPDNTISINDSISFYLSYKIPGNTLNADNKTVTYQVPENIKKIEEHSGSVFDGDIEVGTYEMTEDGKISITFFDDYVKKNAGTNGSPIDGYITFYAEAKDLETDDGGGVDLPYFDNLDIIIGDKTFDNDLTVTKDAMQINNEDCTVKYKITVNSKNGTAKDVTLTDTMYERFIMDSSVPFKVTNKDGAIINKGTSVTDETYTLTEAEDGSSFEMILKQMEPGDTYTIEYTAKLDYQLNDTDATTVHNKVHVESENNEGKKLVGDDIVDTEFKRDVIRKEGTLSPDKKTISWTVTINTSKIDLSGWVLSDYYYYGNNRPVKVTSASISPDPKRSGNDPAEITLPYTFPEGSTDIYVVTYTTDVPSDAGLSAVITNTAKLTHNGDEIRDSAEVQIGAYNPLDKEFVSFDAPFPGENSGDIYVKAKWTISIDTTNGFIEPNRKEDEKLYWVLRDNPWSPKKQWITGRQIREMKNNLKAAMERIGFQSEILIFARIYTLNADGEYVQGDGERIPESAIVDDEKYHSFYVFFDRKLEGEILEFSYYTTVNLGDDSSRVTVTNEANIDYISYDRDSGEHLWTLRKRDGRKTDGGQTTNHDYDGWHVHDKECYEGGKLSKYDKDAICGEKQELLYPNVLSWDIDFRFPEEVAGDIIITETLPEGTHLMESPYTYKVGEETVVREDSYFRFYMDDEETGIEFYKNFGFLPNDEIGREIVETQNSWTIKATKTGEREYKFTIPRVMASACAGLTANIKVLVTMDEDADWITGDKGFENTVSMTYVDDTYNTKKREVSQKQIISKQNIITKTLALDEENDNIFLYTININPKGADLVQESDTLELKDVLSYDKDTPIRVDLRSIELCQVDENGKILENIPVTKVESAEELGDTNGAYVESEEQDDINGLMKKIFTMKISDEMRLQLKYKYRFIGVVGTSVEVSNSASLSGKGSAIDEGKHNYRFDIKNSTAGAVVKPNIRICKYRLGDDAVHLAGAGFKLYKYNAGNKEFEEISNGKAQDGLYTTQEDGYVQIEQLAFNVVYKIVEEKAPEGYLLDKTPHYFYLFDLSPQAETVVYPEDVNEDEIERKIGDTTIFISNIQTTYELPATGGGGTLLYTIGGILLTSMALSAMCYRKNRRKEGAS